MSEIVHCAVYARYSTNNQRDASIEDQIRNCRVTATAKGWHILDEQIYYDKARSGTATNSRDAFKEMMRIAMDNNCPFKRILVDDTSRIARNTREALDVFSLLSFYGIHVYYVAQNIDTAHETAEEMITINGLIDSLYIRNLAKETHRGMEGQILKGFSGGGKRYGYYSEPVYNGKVDIYGNPEADGYRLKINHDEADTIIRIYSLYGEEGFSAKKIVNILNRELKETGRPKPPRGSFWGMSTLIGNKESLKGILNNEIYIGHYHWNRTSLKRNPKNGKKRSIKKSSDNWLTMLRPELAIISDELWEKVKARQKQVNFVANGRYIRGRSVYSLHLLTGLVTCKECGGNIVIVNKHKYGCSNYRNKGASVCTNNLRVKKDIIETHIINRLNIQLNSDSIDCIDYLLSKINNIIEENHSRRNSAWRNSSLSEGLKKVNNEITNYIKAIKAGFISSVVKDHLAEAEQRKKDLEKIIDMTNIKNLSTPEISKSSLMEYLADIRATLNLHPVSGRTFLSKIIEKAYFCHSGDSWSVTISGSKNYSDVSLLNNV